MVFGIETNWFHIGNKPVRGCTACNNCRETNCCVFKDDICNDLLEEILASDGSIIGSPVDFSGPNGALCALPNIGASHAFCINTRLKRNV